jgi:hypothetical protein
VELLNAHKRGIRQRCCIAAGSLTLALAAGDGRAQEAPGAQPPPATARALRSAQRFSELEVKSEFVIRLTHSQFTTWPPLGAPAAGEPVLLAIIGRNRLEESLTRAVEGRTSEYTVRRVDSANLKSRPLPQVLFVDSSERAAYARILSDIGDAPVLAIGEDREFLDAGGLISLLIEEGRPVIEIARARAEGRGFEFSSRLLRVARIYPATEGIRR